jgi:hypothetical protein
MKLGTKIMPMYSTPIPYYFSFLSTIALNLLSYNLWKETLVPSEVRSRKTSRDYRVSLWKLLKAPGRLPNLQSIPTHIPHVQFFLFLFSQKEEIRLLHSKWNRLSHKAHPLSSLEPHSVMQQHVSNQCWRWVAPWSIRGEYKPIINSIIKL